jgi:alkaline phosphatase D
VAAEFVTPAITTGGDDTPYGPYYGPLIPENPHIKFFEGDKRGYFRATLTHQTWQTDVRYVSRVEGPTATVRTGASFVVQDGVPGLSNISIGGLSAAHQSVGAKQVGEGRTAER